MVFNFLENKGSHLLCRDGRAENQNDQMKNMLQVSEMSIERKRTNGSEAWKWKIAQPRGQLKWVNQGVFLWLLPESYSEWNSRSDKDF